jgi:hypothetical protein
MSLLTGVNLTELFGQSMYIIGEVSENELKDHWFNPRPGQILKRLENPM